VRPGGDVILGIAGRPVQTGQDVARVASEELRPGQTVVFDPAGRAAAEHPVRLGARKP
jgi:hypothetical protein